MLILFFQSLCTQVVFSLYFPSFLTPELLTWMVLCLGPGEWSSCS